MKKLYFTLVGLFFLAGLQAQVNCKAVKGYAYSILTLPGTLRVDENGIPLPARVNKERFIYFITNCKTKPTINTVLYGKTIVRADVQPTAERAFSATKSNDQKRLFLTPGKGNYLWKIYVVEKNNKPIPDKNISISVTGKIGTKPFFIIMKEEIELQGPETY
ncbi:MAG: hypothetical protein LH615_06460 [Ferruginibacter sp.]|nr:hypothetical protein [Ferruginibacter sp.]